MTSEPSPAPVDEQSASWAPPIQNQPGGAVAIPAGYGYPVPRTGPGAATALSVVAGVLLILSAVLCLVRPSIDHSTSGLLLGIAILPAVTSIIIAVLLFIPGTRPLGQGMTIGYTIWAAPEILYIVSSFASTGGKLTAASAVLASVASIFAACGWRRARRTGARIVAVIGATVTAALTIIGLNLGWFTATSFGYTCCPAYRDRSFNLAGDIFEFVILAGVLIWAAIDAPSRRSGGLFIGLGVGLGVVVVTTVMSFSSESSISPGAGLYLMVLAIIVSVATAVAVLVRRGPSAVYQQVGGVVAPMPPTVPPFGPTPGAVPVAVQQTNTMAILALVFAFVFSPLGIVFGHIGRKQIRQTGEQGAGLALAGLILGYVFTGISVLYLMLGVILLASLSGTTN